MFATARRSVIIAVLTASMLAPAALAPGAPSTSLDDATKKALALQDRITRTEEDMSALETRIEVTNGRVFRQQSILASTQKTYDAAKARYDSRLVEVYKNSMFDPLSLLLTSTSLEDLYRRMSMLVRIVEQDRRVYEDARIAAAEAQYQASVLDDLKAQLVQLRSLRGSRINDMKRALAAQRAIIAHLTPVQRSYVTARQTAVRMSRKQWKASSIPIGQHIEFTNAVVEPYAEPFRVPAYQPKRYRATGERFTAVCSWYGPGFNGRTAASGQMFNQDDFTCASKTLPFGTRLALTRGNRRIVVVVTDRGPYIAGRDIDLSKAAAFALGFSGVQAVTAEFVNVANGSTPTTSTPNAASPATSTP